MTESNSPRPIIGPPSPTTLTCDILIQVREGRILPGPAIRAVSRPAELAEIKEVLLKVVESMELHFFSAARQSGIIYPGAQQVVPSAAAAPGTPPAPEAPVTPAAPAVETPAAPVPPPPVTPGA
jgi:hypothetical protein